MKKRGLVTALLVATMALATTFTSFAGEWKQDARGWWYQEDDGYYPKSSEVWIDGNNDGMAECYYFDKDGYLITTPFQEEVIDFSGDKSTWIYNMNGDGALMENGMVKSISIQPSPTIKQYGFVNETIKDIIGKDVAYVDSVLGKNDADYFGYVTGEYIKFYQNNSYMVTFLAGRCVGVYCKTSDMFNLTKDDYTIQDIAFELGLEVDGDDDFFLQETQDIWEYISCINLDNDVMNSHWSYSLENMQAHTPIEIVG